ncbi:MAG: FkbM family methyltransferase [Balneolaceae bacterium]|nr:FkbM family methyltransferase [Balneolaceae bacterium]
MVLTYIDVNKDIWSGLGLGMINNFWERFIKLFTKTILYVWYIRWFWKPEEGSINEILNRAAKRDPEFTFVQIGANDGYHNDPLYKFIRAYNWNGIMVEPQVHVFERLKKNHKGNDVLKFENAAISAEKGVIPFYMLAVSTARWATGMSSFDQKHIEEHIDIGFVKKWATREGITLPENREDYIKCVEVQTMNFDDLIAKHGLNDVDGIILDCEGFDSMVLSTVDIPGYNPDIILFEHLHFKDEDYQELTDRLSDLGYELRSDEMDTIAFKR